MASEDWGWGRDLTLGFFSKSEPEAFHFYLLSLLLSLSNPSSPFPLICLSFSVLVG